MNLCGQPFGYGNENEKKIFHPYAYNDFHSMNNGQNTHHSYSYSTFAFYSGIVGIGLVVVCGLYFVFFQRINLSKVPLRFLKILFFAFRFQKLLQKDKSFTFNDEHFYCILFNNISYTIHIKYIV